MVHSTIRVAYLLVVLCLVSAAWHLSAEEPAPTPPDLTLGGKRDKNHDYLLGPTGARGTAGARVAERQRSVDEDAGCPDPVVFGNPKLPVSITTTSMAPPPERSAVELAQLVVADPKKYPAFEGIVKTTDTRPFWRDASDSPSNFGYHWNHNGESEYLNGKAMGEKMAEILGR